MRPSERNYEVAADPALAFLTMHAPADTAHQFGANFVDVHAGAYVPRVSDAG